MCEMFSAVTPEGVRTVAQNLSRSAENTGVQKTALCVHILSEQLDAFLQSGGRSELL